uniref:Bidirectional sugar transporter SWEET n=1 Tax=Kalanchoe fedtschenkoi TaxID=63787 RepID=A0A7N0T807_KALFE
MVLLTTHMLATTFGILGNIVSFMVFLAPMPTFYRIYKKKSTEGFQSIPYSVALFSCTLLLYYGYLKTSGGLMIITINSIGCAIEVAYLAIYLTYASKSLKTQTTKFLLGFNLGVYGAISLATYLSFAGPLRVSVVGWICAIFSVLVFAAPLSIMRLVIKTKSVEYMPFGLSFALTVSAVMWFFYGMLIKDYYIALPNVLGFTFGICQMILYAIYRKPSKKIQSDELKSTTKQQLSISSDIELADSSTTEEEPKKPAAPSEEHVISVIEEAEEEVVEEEEVECGNRMERAVVAEPERIVDIHHSIPVAVCV